jgi:hypothetical protein
MKRSVLNMIRKGNNKAVDKSDIYKTKRSSYDEITNQDNATTLFRISGIVHFEFAPQSQSTRLPMQSYWWRYVKLCVEAGLNFDPTIGSSTRTTVQVLSCSLSSNSWPACTHAHARTHSCCWTGTLPAFIRLVSRCLRAPFKINVHHEETMIAGHRWRSNICDGNTTVHSVTGIPYVFLTLVVSLG